MRYPEHITGTVDYLGTEATRLLKIADACSVTFALYGYERVMLPILEQADIFLQRSGEEIRSRMYIFSDPKAKMEICLRPEMTISIARAYLERMMSRRLPVRLSYQGDVFRYDKVREGRYRQFLQTGIEFIGSENRIAADAEAVAIAIEATKRAGVQDFRLLLGDLEIIAEFIDSLPVSNDVRARLLETYWRREAFNRLIKRLSEARPQTSDAQDAASRELGEMLSSLGENASRKLVREMLSLFVEKETGYRSLDEIAERFLQRFSAGRGMHLSKECTDLIDEFLSISGPPEEVLQKVESLLKRIGKSTGPALEAAHRRLELLRKQNALPEKSEMDMSFRRGIEYYTGFIFEMHCDRLGPVSQICGGGRYDRLLSLLGASRPIPAVGFALGLNRLLLAAEKGESSESISPSIDAVLVTVGDVDSESAWKIAQLCRQAGCRVRAEFESRKLKTVLGQASEDNVPFAIIVGEDELKDESVRIKNMSERKEEIISLKHLEDYLQAALKNR
jgi:histidyl-tRNA synthetase